MELNNDDAFSCMKGSNRVAKREGTAGNLMNRRYVSNVIAVAFERSV